MAFLNLILKIIKKPGWGDLLQGQIQMLKITFCKSVTEALFQD